MQQKQDKPWHILYETYKAIRGQQKQREEKEKSRPLYSDKYIDPQVTQKVTEEKVFQKRMHIYNINPTV